MHPAWHVRAMYPHAIAGHLGRTARPHLPLSSLIGDPFTHLGTFGLLEFGMRSLSTGMLSLKTDPLPPSVRVQYA